MYCGQWVTGDPDAPRPESTLEGWEGVKHAAQGLGPRRAPTTAALAPDLTTEANQCILLGAVRGRLPNILLLRGSPLNEYIPVDGIHNENRTRSNIHIILPEDFMIYDSYT